MDKKREKKYKNSTPSLSLPLSLSILSNANVYRKLYAKTDENLYHPRPAVLASLVSGDIN